jgi:hypothetical protein
VTVLEAADTLGGGTRSSDLTLPGLIHDECSAAHPLAVDTAFSRRFDLAAHGLNWLWPEVQYTHPLDGGAGAAAYRSVKRTAAGLGRDGKRWQAVFGPLAARFADITSDFLRPMLHVPEHPLALARFGALSAPPAGLLARLFATDEARALFAGVAAHAFRPFGAPMSSAIGVALGAAAHRYGWPVAEGGSASISRAMVSLGESLGVRFETGVRVRSLAEVDEHAIVMLDVAPAAAANIAGDRMPRRVARALSRYRHGPGTFKVDFACVRLQRGPLGAAGYGRAQVGGGMSRGSLAGRSLLRGHSGVGQTLSPRPTPARGPVEIACRYRFHPHPEPPRWVRPKPTSSTSPSSPRSSLQRPPPLRRARSANWSWRRCWPGREGGRAETLGPEEDDLAEAVDDTSWGDRVRGSGC